MGTVEDGEGRGKGGAGVGRAMVGGWGTSHIYGLPPRYTPNLNKCDILLGTFLFGQRELGLIL